MIRSSIFVAGLLAVVGCGSQSPSSEIGSTGQDLSVAASDAIVRAEPWSARLVQNTDYWDFGAATADGSPANHKMIAFVSNASDNTPDNVVGDPTRMVWLVSNARVFKVYEVDQADLGSMLTIMQSAFDDVEHTYVATGGVAFGSKVMVGVDGGAVVPKGGGTPHGFPASVVTTMQNAAAKIAVGVSGGEIIPKGGGGPHGFVGSELFPEPWTTHKTQDSDYWDFGTAAVGETPASHQMIALVANATDADGDQPTRMVWLVSNARVYKVYEVPEADLESMMTMMQNAFGDVQNQSAAAGELDFGSKVKAGVDGGIVTKKGGGGPPHGFSASIVQSMQNAAVKIAVGVDGGLVVPKGGGGPHGHA